MRVERNIELNLFNINSDDCAWRVELNIFNVHAPLGKKDERTSSEVATMIVQNQKKSKFWLKRCYQAWRNQGDGPQVLSLK